MILRELSWLDPTLLLLVAGMVSLLAGAVRGYAGFGYSAITMAALAAFVVPAPLVIAIQALETVASGRMLRHVVGQGDRGWIRSVMIGNATVVPLGALVIAVVPADAARVLVSVLLLAGALAVKLAVQNRLEASMKLRVYGGIGSGLFNGIAGAGGVVVALLMAASATPPAVIRATMVSALFWMSIYTMAWTSGISLWAGTASLVAKVLLWIAILLPSMMLGVAIGTRLFHKSMPDRQRAIVLNILIGTAAAGLLAGVLRSVAAR